MYVIVGGGPTGLCIAWVLAYNNHKVCLIEADSILGGSWNVHWKDGKYWSENSPRVLINEGVHIDFLKSIGMEDNGFSKIYGSTFEMFTKFYDFLKQYLIFSDYLKLLNGIIHYTFHKDDNKTFEEWMVENKISCDGKKALTIFSITINDIPEKTSAYEVFKTIQPPNRGLIQMNEPNKWTQLIEDQFMNMKNVQILKNTRVEYLEYNQGLIQSCLCFDKIKKRTFKIHGERFVLCTQSSGLWSILQKSSTSVKNNWKNEYEMEQWVKHTHYNGFGFQLHFTETVEYPHKWCWVCEGEWNVIILPVSQWLVEYSKDDKIKTVWSCVVTKTNAKSMNIGKTLNECEKDEAIQECMRQIHLKYSEYGNLPKPFKVTTSDGLKRINGKWKSKNTGFTKGKYDYLEMKGNIDNLYAVGCFNKTINQVANMETAIESSMNYLKTYENVKNPIKKSDQSNKKLIFLFVVCVLYFYLKK